MSHDPAHHTASDQNEARTDAAADTGAEETPATLQGRPPRRRKRRKWLWTIAVLIVLLVALIALAPTLVSTPVGSRTVVNWVDASIAGSLDVDDITLGWFQGPTVTGIKLRDPQGALVADVSRVAAPQADLLPIALGGRQFGQVSVEARTLHIQQARGQPTNLQLALAPADGAAQPEAPADEPASEQTEQPTQVDKDLSVSMHLTVDKAVYEAPDMQPIEMPDVDATLDVSDVQNIGLKVQSALKQGDEQGRIDADVTLSDMFSDAGVLQWQSGAVKADMTLDQFPLVAVDRIAQQDGRLSTLLGEQLDANVDASGPIDSLTASVTGQSEHLNVDMKLAREGQMLRSTDSTVNLNVTPAAFTRLMGEGENAATLLSPFQFQLELGSFAVPRGADGALQLADAAIQASATLGDVRLRVPQRGDVGLADTRLELTSNALGQQITANLNATASYGNVTKPVQAELTVTNALRTGQGDRQVALNARDLPIALADTVAQMDGKLTETLGDTLTLRVEAAQPKSGALTFNGDIDAPRLSGPFKGSIDPAARQYALTTPAPMQMTLTPQAWDAWLGAQGARLALVEPMPVRLNVKTLDVGLREPTEQEGGALAMIDPQRTRVTADLTLPRAVVENPDTRERLRLVNGQISFQGEDLSDVLKVLTKMTVESLTDAARQAAQQRTPADRPSRDQHSGEQGDDPQANAGSIESTSQVSELVNDAGRLDPTGAHVKSRATVQRVPSALIDALAQQGGQLAALLGPHVSADATLDYQRRQGGAANVKINSANVQGEVASEIDKRGRVRLTKDAPLNVRITPETSRVLLARVNPMLASVVAAKAPIDLRLSQESFSVPIDPFKWQGVSAKGRLKISELALDAQGFAGQVLGLLGKFGVGEGESRYTGRLSPVNFDMNKGKLSYDQLRLTLDGMRFEFDGTVNMVNKDLDLTMRLGGKRFADAGVSGIALPIGGKINSPNLDTDRLDDALIESGVKRGIQELLGGDRDEDSAEKRDRQQQNQRNQKNDGQQDESSEDEDESGSPIDSLFDRLREQTQDDEDE